MLNFFNVSDIRVPRSCTLYEYGFGRRGGEVVGFYVLLRVMRPLIYTVIVTTVIKSSSNNIYR